jgi:hypothetical protein
VPITTLVEFQTAASDLETLRIYFDAKQPQLEHVKNAQQILEDIAKLLDEPNLSPEIVEICQENWELISEVQDFLLQHSSLTVPTKDKLCLFNKKALVVDTPLSADCFPAAPVAFFGAAPLELGRSSVFNGRLLKDYI